jgi:hypothetical protein
VVRDANQIELSLLSFLLNEPQLNLDGVDLLQKFIMGMMLSKHLSDFFMRKFIMGLVLFL